MRTRLRLASLLLLICMPACESGQGGSEDEGERSVEEWIELCEAQQSGADCEAVPPGMRGSETWRCEETIILQTSEPDCYSQVNDSRCLAVSDRSNSEPGYIFAELGTLQNWLIEAQPNMSVYGSTVEPCVLADDGVTWVTDPMCACAGNVTDDPGG